MKKYFCFMMTITLFSAGLFNVFAQKTKPSIGAKDQNPIAIIHARIIDGNGGAPIERDKIFLFLGGVFSLPFSSETLPPFTKK